MIIMNKMPQAIILLFLVGILLPWNSVFSQKLFYEYYDEGLEKMDENKWSDAAELFNKAILLEPHDSGRKRTYGLNFIEYFPNRQLGISYYNLGLNKEAKSFLTKSISDDESDLALEFLSKVGNSNLADNQNDITPPKDLVSEQKISAPPLLQTNNISFQEPSGNNVLEGEEEGKISFQIRNEGSGTAYGVNVEIENLSWETNLLYRDYEIGNILPNEIKTINIPVTAKKEVGKGEVTLQLSIIEKNGFNPDDLKITFNTNTYEPPQLDLMNTGIADDGSGESRGNGNNCYRIL